MSPKFNKTKRDKAYTPYKAVAERWAESIRDQGAIEYRADMEKEY